MFQNQNHVSAIFLMLGFLLGCNKRTIPILEIMLFQFSRMDRKQKLAEDMEYSLRIWIFLCLSGCPIHEQLKLNHGILLNKNVFMIARSRLDLINHHQVESNEKAEKCTLIESSLEETK